MQKEVISKESSNLKINLYNEILKEQTKDTKQDDDLINLLFGSSKISEEIPILNIKSSHHVWVQSNVSDPSPSPLQ